MKAARQYLQDILKAILRIENYTEDGKDVFINNSMMQDAVIRNFEIIGEAVKRVPRALLEQQQHIPWQDIAGFSDVLIHDYDEIDPDEVWLTVERDLPILHQAIKDLLSNLPDDEN